MWVQNFYKDLVDMQFTVIFRNFASVPVVETDVANSGQNGPFSVPCVCYVPDPAWYEQNITAAAVGYDRVVFVVNVSDVSPKTGLVPAGLNTGSWNGVDQITLFLQPNSENWEAEQNGVLYPSAIALLMAHELCHGEYQEAKAPVDNTHLYFYSTNPAGAIADLQKYMQNENAQTQSSIALYNAAKVALGTTLVPVGDNPDLGCAISLSVLWSRVFPNSASVLDTVSTAVLLKALMSSPLFKQVLDPLAGDIIISATGTSVAVPPPIANGHCGVVGYSGIMSNNSLTGLWSEVYTLDTWNQRYAVQGSYPVLFFRPQ